MSFYFLQVLNTGFPPSPPSSSPSIPHAHLLICVRSFPPFLLHGSPPPITSHTIVNLISISAAFVNLSQPLSLRPASSALQCRRQIPKLPGPIIKERMIPRSLPLQSWDPYQHLPFLLPHLRENQKKLLPHCRSLSSWVVEQESRASGPRTGEDAGSYLNNLPSIAVTPRVGAAMMWYGLSEMELCG